MQGHLPDLVSVQDALPPQVCEFLSHAAAEAGDVGFVTAAFTLNVSVSLFCCESLPYLGHPNHADPQL